MFQLHASDRPRHQLRKPAWWMLYTVGFALVGAVGSLELNVPPGAVRTVLECAAVIFGFGLMLFWRHCNRARWM
jgi:hypothetical protein